MGSSYGRRRHLHDDRLYECYIATQTGEPVDPLAAEHLADCPSCHARYMELAAVMSDVRADADAEIDALFSEEALRAQQAHIARRLEHLGHAARVISFPHHQVHASGAEGWRITPRWLAAAAAAGLFVGVAVGSAFESPAFSHAHRAVAVTKPAPVAPALPIRQQVPQAAPSPSEAAPAVNADNDSSDEFLAELEFALERPRTSELRALDELTPHVREISLTSRVQ